jgi:positive regulator of sigma E activity
LLPQRDLALRLRLVIQPSQLWYGDCIISMMLTTLTAPDLTWLFLAVVVSLLFAAVWAFWEIEQRAHRSHKSDRFG